MKFKIKSSIVINWLILVYLISIVILAINGKITFGHGLGDLFYILGISLGILAQLILNLIFSRKKFLSKRDQSNWIIGILFLGIAILVTYEFTLGRGPEYKWNGEILINRDL